MVPGRDRAAAAFFSAAAKRTNGRAVAMRSAANLADVVIGASLEEMDLDALLPRIQEITEELRASDATVSDADVRKSVFERLSKTTKSRRSIVHSALADDDVVTGAATLSEAKALYAAAAPPPPPAPLGRARSSAGLFRSGSADLRLFRSAPEVAEDAAPEVELTDDYVTEDAIARAWNKGKALGKYA